MKKKKMLKLEELLKYTGLNLETLESMLNNGSFPKPSFNAKKLPEWNRDRIYIWTIHKKQFEQIRKDKEAGIEY